MDQPDFENESDFVGEPRMLLDKDGEKIVVIVKATYELAHDGGGLEVAPPKRRRPLRSADIPWGKPEISSIAYAGDVCIRKPGTDVLVAARAHAPNGVPTPKWPVAVRAGHLQKFCDVYGMRIWQAQGQGLTPPSPATVVDMRYDNAWGGADDSDPNKFVEDARNPVGRGVTSNPSSLTHKPGPCIEDPVVPILNARTRPPPAGIGPIGRHWMPRRLYTGTYDDAWLDDRAPLPPLDQDDRMNVCASPGLWSETPLVGAEQVALMNLLPGRGAISFLLPNVRPDIEMELPDQKGEVQFPHLDTIVVDCLGFQPAALVVVELTWRAVYKAPRRMKGTKIILREAERR